MTGANKLVRICGESTYPMVPKCRVYDLAGYKPSSGRTVACTSPLSPGCSGCLHGGGRLVQGQAEAWNSVMSWLVTRLMKCSSAKADRVQHDSTATGPDTGGPAETLEDGDLRR